MITSTIRDVFSNVVIGMIFIILVITILGFLPKLWNFLKKGGDSIRKNIFTSFWGVVLFLGAYCIGICITDFGDYVLTNALKSPPYTIYNVLSYVPRKLIDVNKDDVRYSTLINSGIKVKLNDLGKDVFNHKDLVKYKYEKLDSNLKSNIDFTIFYDSVRNGYTDTGKIDKINRNLINEIYYVSHYYCNNQSTLFDELSFYDKKIEFFIGLTLLSFLSLTFFIYYLFKGTSKN